MADDVQVRFGASIGELISGIDRVKELIESVGAPVKALSGLFEGIGTAITAGFGIERVMAFYELMAELGERTERTMAIFGQSSKEVGELDFIAKATGTSADGLSHAMERFALSLQRAHDGTTPTAQGLEALGLRAKDLIGLPLDQTLGRIADRFSQFADGLNKTAIASALFGSRMGGDLIPLLDKGSAGLAELRQRADDTGTVLGEKTVEELSHFNQSIVTAEASLKGLAIAVAGVPAAGVLEWITNLAQNMRLLVESGKFWEAELDGLSTAWDSFAASLRNAARIILDALHLDWNKVIADWKEGTERQEDIVREHNIRVGKMLLAAKFQQQQALSSIAGDHKPEAPELPKVDRAGAEAAREQIKQVQAAYQITVDELNSEVKLGRITENEKTALQLEALNQRELDGRAAYDKLAELYKGDAVQFAKVEAEKTQWLLGGLRDRLKETQQNLIANTKAWQDGLTPIQSAWDSQLRGLLDRTTSWAQAEKNIMADLALETIKEFERLAIVKPIIDGLSSSLKFNPADIAGQVTKMIESFTGPIFAAATAFLFPELGPAAVPAAAGIAAAVDATAMGLSGSAAGGAWEIPNVGTYLLHPQEMVLPAGVAETLRSNFAAGGSFEAPGGGGGGGAGGGDTHIHFNVSAMDGQSVQRFFVGNSRQIANAIRNEIFK